MPDPLNADPFNNAKGEPVHDHRMIKPLLFAAPLLALSACAMTAEAGPREGPARLGQTVYVGGPKVRPVKVIEDSRCPANARCIWAGRLIVRVDVSGGKWHRRMDLTLGEPQAVADGMLVLNAVTPEKYTNKAIKPTDYRFGFEFNGGL